MLVRGQQVGRYEVLELVGHGGMASVYRVRHRQLDSIHALKLLDVHKERVRERLLQEGRAQAALKHPNIVQVTDVLTHEGAPVLVMEYVDGPPVDAWIRDHGAPELATGVRWFRGVTQGLRAAHVRRLVHRDLKPANVLLQPDGDGYRPRIVDFGLVKTVRDGPSATGPLTRGGVAMGTPEFMAPEQIRDAANVDHRADLYSLGCLLYLLLCGRLPFRGGSLVELLTAIGAGRYPRPTSLAPHLPQTLEQLVDRLLRPEPEARPQSCDEVLAWLDRVDLLLPTGPGRLAPAELRRVVSVVDEPTWSAHYGSEPEVEALRLPRRSALLGRARGGIPMLAPVLAAVLALGTAAASPRGGPPGPQPRHRLSDLGLDESPDEGELPRPEPPAPSPPVAPPPPVPATPAGADTPAPLLEEQPAIEPEAEARVEVTVAGDASRVWLVRDGVRHLLPAAVTAGSYEILAIFPETEPVSSGEVRIGADPLVVRCSAFAQRCVEKR